MGLGVDHTGCVGSSPCVVACLGNTDFASILNAFLGSWVKMLGERRRVVLLILDFCCGDSFWITHLRDGTRRMPKYVYGSFCERKGNCWFL